MYIVSSFKNVAMNDSRYADCKFPVNGSVSFSFLKDLIFVFD